MLVLTRFRDESIMIGDDIVITVTDIRGDKVRIGIDAPAAVQVHRREVYEVIQREKSKQKKTNAAPITNIPTTDVVAAAQTGR